VLSRGTLTFTRGDKPLLAKQFTYESDRMTGRGIVVVEGLSSYLAAASALKPASREAAVNAFLRSFKLEPRNKAELASVRRRTAQIFLVYC